jgi:mitofusin
MEVRRDPRSILFILILLLLIHSPEQPGQQPYNLRNRYDEVIGHEWDELDILNRTRYGDFDARNNKWLNISGLNEEDGFVWELLNPVKQRAAARVKDSLGDVAEGLLDGTAEDTARLPMYRNISGYVQGEWIRSPLARIRTPSDVNSSASIDNPFPMAEYDRNLTGASGHVRIHLTELDERMRTDENKTVSEVSARIIIGDDDSMGDNWWEFVLHGVHYPNLGGSVLTTTSEK